MHVINGNVTSFHLMTDIQRAAARRRNEERRLRYDEEPEYRERMLCV